VPASRAGGETRCDEQLRGRIRKNHRADVSPVEHRPSFGGEAALEIEQGPAHTGDRRDCRRCQVGLRSA